MSDLRPLVDSWDVFDTLLTRFVLDPLQVFALIDHRHPGHAFANRRVQAQAALDAVGKPYVIYEIYAKMVELGLAPELANALLREELATEQALMLPVRANVDRVRPNDLLISDMYLPGEIITGLLAQVCDLHCVLPVIRSNWGKQSGTLWPKLLQHYIIRTHYGDNPSADAAVPRQFGIDTVLCREVAPTEWEMTLAKQGLAQLALIQRETRLRSLRADAGEFEKLVVGPYLSLLLGFAGTLLHRFGEAAGYAFLSRDCDDLGRVFRALFAAVRSCNLDLSRRLTRDASHDDFFGNVLTADWVLVDGVSTGRSVSAMLSRIGRTGQAFHTLLLLDHLLDAEAGSKVTIGCEFRASEFGARHYPLELLLQSPYPPVMAVTADAASGGWVRAFAQPELSLLETKVIAAKCESVTQFIRTLRLRGLPMLSEAQNRALMQAALAAILAADLQASAFPSFRAREIFAPY
jgi:hypothetical protein